MSNAVSIEEARAALAADRQSRAEACREAVSAALEEYRCQLVAVIVPSPDGRSAMAQVQIVAME